MHSMWNRYKEAWRSSEFRISFLFALLLFSGALWVNSLAIKFATEHASNPVNDIILSNTRAYEVDGLFVYGTLIMVLFSFFVVFAHPKRIPFALHALTLFILIRAVFTSLTHTGPFEETYVSDFGTIINHAFFGADHFFSGHTGMPFLGALAFWHIPWIRYSFIAASIFFATVVLLGHLHYTIDVAAAFFITYAIYHIAIQIFPREHRLFKADTPGSDL
jgi:hypothetical protein